MPELVCGTRKLRSASYAAAKAVVREVMEGPLIFLKATRISPLNLLPPTPRVKNHLSVVISSVMLPAAARFDICKKTKGGGKALI